VWAQRRQREATAALNELVSQHVIVSYSMNLDTRRRTEPIRVAVVAEDGDYLWRERLWLRVRQALAPLGEKLQIQITFGRQAPNED
jgi:hypothetical protein